METQSKVIIPPKPKPMEPAYFIEYLSKANLTNKMFDDIAGAIKLYNDACSLAAEELDSALENITGIKIH
jgi:hypothetical protein